jgi:hypothetical protein
MNENFRMDAVLLVLQQRINASYEHTLMNTFRENGGAGFV